MASFTNVQVIKELFVIDTVVRCDKASDGPYTSDYSNSLYFASKIISEAFDIRPYKKKILVLRHRRALKIPPDETFLSWEGKKIAAGRQINIIFYK